MKSSGFTIVELLAVMAIMGMLSSVVLNNVSATKDKANNSNSTNTVKHYENALNLYYSDHGHYPVPSGYGVITPTGIGYTVSAPGSCLSDSGCANSGFQDALVPTYISNLPNIMLSPVRVAESISTADGSLTYQNYLNGYYYCTQPTIPITPSNPNPEQFCLRSWIRWAIPSKQKCNSNSTQVVGLDGGASTCIKKFN